MKYSPEWELHTIPDPPLYAEVGRRRGIHGGRPRKLIPCPKCGKSRSARQRRTPCECGHKGKHQ